MNWNRLSIRLVYVLTLVASLAMAAGGGANW